MQNSPNLVTLTPIQCKIISSGKTRPNNLHSKFTEIHLKLILVQNIYVHKYVRNGILKKMYYILENSYW
jgi:hypothetical protein